MVVNRMRGSQWQSALPTRLVCGRRVWYNVGIGKILKKGAVKQMIKQMYSRSAEFQRFETLKRNREKRTQQKLMFLEGVHPIEQAIAHGWQFAAMAYAGGRRLSGWAQDMLAKARPEVIYEMSPELHADLSDRENPCELIALLRQRTDGLQRLTQAAQSQPNPLFVLFDRPQGPGNLGTLIRSADAFGACGVLTTGHAADFYDPQCLRATIGTLFARPFAALESMQDALDWAASLPVRLNIVGTSAHGTCLLEEVDLTGPTLLLVGNETFGLSKGWKEHCDVLAKIPIQGSASSLNAGCAASICLYEIDRQRRQAGRAANC